MLFRRPAPTTRLLMVCMGNVCRSPMAQAVTLHLAEVAGLGHALQVHSAGTHAVGGSQPLDPRAKAVLSGRGYPIGRSRSRQITEKDFQQHDLVLGMDQENLNELRRICPGDHIHKLRLFLEYAPGAAAREVPDPYYGNLAGFERVLELCEAGARGLIDQYRQTPPR